MKVGSSAGGGRDRFGPGWLIPVAIGAIPALTLATLAAGDYLTTGFGRSAGSALAAAVLLGALVVVYRERPALALGLPESAMVFLAVAFLVASVHGEGSGVVTVLVRSVVPFFLAWILGRALARISGGGTLLWWIGVAFVLINAPLGILETLTNSDLIASPGTGLVSIGGTGFVRPNGFMSTDIDFGLSILLAIALVLGGPPAPGRERWILPVALLGTVAVLLASFRTGWIVLFLMWALWLPRPRIDFQRIGVLAWVALVGTTAIVAALLIGLLEPSTYVQQRILNSSNIDARLGLWEKAWQIFLAHPWAGVGLTGFKVDPVVLDAGLGASTPHNLWLGVLSEMGLLGLAALLAVVGTTVASVMGMFSRGLAGVGQRGVIWTCGTAFFFSLTFQPIGIPIASVLIGLAIGAVRGFDLSTGEDDK